MSTKARMVVWLLPTLAGLAFYGCGGSATLTAPEDRRVPDAIADEPKTASAAAEPGMTVSDSGDGGAGVHTEEPSPSPTEAPPAAQVSTPESTSPVGFERMVGNSVDDTAPTFTLPAVADSEYSLVDFRGDKNVVVVFYRAFW